MSEPLLVVMNNGDWTSQPIPVDVNEDHQARAKTLLSPPGNPSLSVALLLATQDALWRRVQELERAR